MKLCSCHVAILRQKTSYALQTHLLDMGKSGKSFYAVRVGRTPGQIFRTWPECEAQVTHTSARINAEPDASQHADTLKTDHR